MHRRGRKGSLCWRVFFSLRTSSFPARRKSSSALSRAGNDQGFMTNTIQVPLFGHQAGVNGLTGQRVSVLFFCGGMTGTLRLAALQQEAGTVPRSCSLCTLHPCWHSFLLFRIAKSMTARACRCDSCVGKSCGVLVAFSFRQPACHSFLHFSCALVGTPNHGALSLSQSKDFLIAESTCVFCVEVAVKKPLRRPWFFPHLPGYRAGSEPCRSGSAEWRIPWQIYWHHLRRAEVTGRLEVQEASLLSLLALTCNCVRPSDWHGAHELARSEGGYPAFAIAMSLGQPLLIAMHRRGRRGSLCWRVFFSLRTSSFPARRKSSSALSRAGNDQGFMTNMVQAPLFSK